MSAIGISLLWEDGTPEGIRTAAVPGWSAGAVASPRDQVESILGRPELSSPGVYVLSGLEPHNPERCVYVGESENVAGRIRTHHWNYENKGIKHFWDQTYMITSSDSFFTKAHALYVESELIERVKLAGRARLKSQVQPKRPALPPGGIVLAKQFLRFIEIVLPAMGLNMLSATEPNAEPVESLSDTEKRRLAFWQELLSRPTENFDLFQNTKPSTRSFITAFWEGFQWAFVVSRHLTRVEFYIRKPNADMNKAVFDALFAHRQQIEADFGSGLNWQRLDDKTASRISFGVKGGLDDQGQWPSIIDSALDAMQRLYPALAPHVRAYIESQST